MQQRPAALITGGSKGLGLETAKQLAAMGWSIGLFARDEKALANAQSEILLDYPDPGVMIYAGDVTDYCRVSEVVTQFAQDCGGNSIQAAIHAAGQLRAIGPLGMTDSSKMQADMATSLMGAANLFHASAPWLEKSHSGAAAIGFVGPGFNEGLGFGSAYAAAQAGLVRLMENLALERTWPERAGVSPAGQVGYYALYSAVTPTGVMNHILSSEEGRRWLHRFTEMFAEGKEVEPHVPAATAAWLAHRHPAELSGRVVSGMLDPELIELRLAVLNQGDKGRLRMVF
jgi:NAD(P)-dependent dehydrogenase (short-subunit alcohol dehydrogenase family)